MDLHAMHELLLMGHDQAAMRWLGRITASKAPIEERMQEYSAELRPEPSPNCRSRSSVPMHATSYFSENLDSKERQHFLRSLEWCAEGKAPQSAPLLMGRSWALGEIPSAAGPVRTLPRGVPGASRNGGLHRAEPLGRHPISY